MTEIVAEISGNHGGSLENALELISQAKWAGADAVKFQCFDPSRLAEKRSKNLDVVALAKGVPLLELYRQTHTPKEWFPQLIEHANDIAWFSSVFDPDDVAFLETLGCPRYKISAFEMLDWELIKAVKETGKPIVISVRPTKDVTILHATNYQGWLPALGFSDHGGSLISPTAPMIEWHLRLEGVDTKDKDFSMTAEKMKIKVDYLRKQAALLSA